MIVRIRGLAEFDVEILDNISEEGETPAQAAEDWLAKALQSPYYRQLGGDGKVVLSSFRPDASRVL
jgi:hypothetical protein